MRDDGGGGDDDGDDAGTSSGGGRQADEKERRKRMKRMASCSSPEKMVRRKKGKSSRFLRTMGVLHVMTICFYRQQTDYVCAFLLFAWSYTDIIDSCMVIVPKFPHIKEARVWTMSWG